MELKSVIVPLMYILFVGFFERYLSVRSKLRSLSIQQYSEHAPGL